MATVSTTSILGSDSISASRLTINSNFLLLENWINGFVSTFGIDTNNGILDLSRATTGSIYAKTGYFDQLQFPSTGTFTARILSSGAASFSDVSTTSFTSSGLTTISGSLVQNGISTFGATATFNSGSSVNMNGSLVTGPLGSNISKNTTYLPGLTAGQAFPANTLGGGGIYTTIDAPYQLTGLEDVIYANCGPTGFYMSINGLTGGSGGTAANLPAGYRIRIVNTSGSTGYIYTGIQGSTNTYYTGFNTNASYGNYATGGIVVNANSQYQASVHLQWEPRISQGQPTQAGSWIVLSGINVTI
jgi:hypothetical protein